MDNRHAYIILAHGEFELLSILLSSIDDFRNDIYVHIDAKSKGYNIESIKKIVKHANIDICSEIKVNWGGYSIVKAYMLLFEKAIRTYHSYYHVISGVDLPLMTQDKIHELLAVPKYEYIHFISNPMQAEFLERVDYYHFFQEYVKYKHVGTLFKVLEKTSILLQKLIGIHRFDGSFVLQKGCNWVSITHGCVEYILSKKKFIDRTFRYSYIADEMFIQTVVVNSPYMDHVWKKSYSDDIKDALRFIDWNRGLPYTFTTEDYNELIESNCLFARKFSLIKDREIVERIAKHAIGDTCK